MTIFNEIFIRIIYRILNIDGFSLICCIENEIACKNRPSKNHQSDYDSNICLNETINRLDRVIY